MSTYERYQHHIQQGDIKFDPHQVKAVKALDRLHYQLEKSHNSTWLSWFSQWGKQTSPKGLYLWGGVGRGKTFLMDLFYQSLSVQKKKRIHFHRFMLKVHQLLSDYEGKRDPLAWVAKALARDTQVLCFDEFFVSDIGDAMLLGRLLHHLFDLEVTLVATSNVKPDDLYGNGLARDQFLPAIELLKQYTEIIHLKGDDDYRLKTLQETELYHYPLGAEATDYFKQTFKALSPEKGLWDQTITISDRPLACVAVADSIIWCSFQALCMQPRAAMDYIEIARSFHTVMINDVVAMHDGMLDAVRRFITLVDAFYDHQVTLILSAQVSMENLYQGTGLKFEFARTQSRLHEMQSSKYLSKPHLS